VSIITGLLFGFVPALRATRADLTPMMKQGAAAPGQARLRKALVSGQIAISALLLASAGLFVHSLHNLRSLDPGFRAGGLHSFSINPQLMGYPAERSRRLFTEFERALRETPGIAAVTTAKTSVLTGSVDTRSFEIEGYQPPPGTGITINTNWTGAGFFSAMGIPLVAGREFRESDRAGAPGVAVVNETFAKGFFEGANPIGKRLTLRRSREIFEIVGVVKDAKYDNLREEPRRFAYLPAAQDLNPGGVTFYVRTPLSGVDVGAAVRGIARRLDASMPVNGPQTVEQQILTSVFVDRMVAALASTFAVLATALAAIGLYGVIAWAVSRRRREIGIRMALGAEPGKVLRMVLADVVRLGLAGIVIAVPLWILSGRLLKALLFGVTERDPLTLAAALAVVLVAAVASGFVPAWRASRIDPNSAIRHE
jgi:predicted permease